MGAERARPMLLPTTLLVLTAAIGAQAICPARCHCNDEALRASCQSANLDFFPIQLNPEVHYINLTFNKISSIDFILYNYNNLITLDLSSNKIQKLGKGNFEYQGNLKYLNLSNNEVGNLSKDSLKGLHALTELDISYNKLEELHDNTFTDLHSLRVLKLNNNLLIYLAPGLLKTAKFLQHFQLDSNQLVEVPVQALADLVNLQHLSLSNNLIESVPEDQMPNLTELQTLMLDGNVIRAVHPGALSGLTSLVSLDLGDNNFTAVPTASLAKLSNLIKLRLSGNFISAVGPVAFRGLFHLRFLYLNGLELLEVIDSRAFVDNINLESVWLDDNIALAILPTRLFHGNPRVTHISIKNNQLKTLEATHFPLDQLKHLRLGGNPLECNCSLLWLWRLEHDHKIFAKSANKTDNPHGLVIDSDSIKCAGPEPLKDTLLEEATESQMGCSMGLIATIFAVCSGCLLLGTVSVLLYFGLRAKHASSDKPEKREISMGDLPQCANGTNMTGLRGLALGYEEPRINRYMVGPPLIADYPVMPHCHWDKYREEDLSVSDIYIRHFNTAEKTRPHLFYV